MNVNHYPEAHRSDVVDLLHGHRVADPYRWLEEPDQPATQQWLAGQRRLTETYIATLPGQDRLRSMLRGLVTGPTASPVKPAGPRRFRVSRPTDARPWIIQVADEPDAPWRTAVDLHRLGDNAAVRRWQPSPTGRFLAVQMVVGGSENVTPLALVDVPTGEVLERNELTRYTPVEWRADEESFFYVRRHLDTPGSGVYLHQVGAGPDRDELLLGDDNPMGRYHLALWNDRWLVISGRVGTGRTSTARVVDLASGGQTRELPLAPTSASTVSIDHSGRILAVSTANAECGELVVAEPDGSGGWRQPRVLLPETAPAVLSAVTLVRVGETDRLVVLRTLDGYSEMSIHDAGTGEKILDVGLPGEGTVSAIAQTGLPTTLALSYTDWVTPLSVWHLDVESGRVTPSSPEIMRQGDVAVLRTSYRSFDGTDVPLTILTRHDSMRRAAPRSTVLTCYGGFGISFRPGFQPDALTWVLVGGTVAIAGVRGGGERGRQWHRDGSGLKKINAVRDLHAGGDWLVANGWTSNEKLALLGGSNGGLVVVAAIVRRPTSYAALACAGAPLDMVRYERWGLGRAWREEYGSARDPEALQALLRLSPYHNVAADAGRFPAMWLATGTNDTRVDPLNSRKMVALLQHATTAGPVLLSVAEGAGHVGGGPDADRLGAAMLAFLAVHTGLVVDEKEIADDH